MSFKRNDTCARVLSAFMSPLLLLDGGVTAKGAKEELFSGFPWTRAWPYVAVIFIYLL